MNGAVHTTGPAELTIGPFRCPNPYVLAPMAGVTDLPFRQLARRLGAGLTVGEMVSCDPTLRNTRKSRQRLDHGDEPAPRIVQIVGADPQRLSDAARYNVDLGADIIDINMGCPAKKVCGTAAGSALLSDEPLVGRILDAVVAAVEAPVTLKIRTGPTRDDRNALRIAAMAESAGVAALTVHGRSRAEAFRGAAEHDTVRAIKSAVRLTVIANGDIDSPRRAAEVLAHTGADGVMIGRAAQGNPWIFAQAAYGAGVPSLAEVRDVLLEHIRALHAFYGPGQGVRIARKHLSWYCERRPGFAAFWPQVRTTTCPDTQTRMVDDHFRALIEGSHSMTMGADGHLNAQSKGTRAQGAHAHSADRAA